MCGEQHLHLLKLIWILGSPPRVRGTVLRILQIIQSPRITPACAGNSGICND